MPKEEEDLFALEAEHGREMIEIKIRLRTNDIADEPDKIMLHSSRKMRKCMSKN